MTQNSLRGDRTAQPEALMDTEQEQKTPAELKEIRLARKAAQEAEGVKAMADIAAADVAIRKRTEELRALRLAREAEELANPPAPKPKATRKKKTT
ncbi:transcriptional regulator [Bradyrhizobium sp. NFR13]|jgi:hypothetical protein|uniref:transcriptional regulator n=1 Tax=Bradyrhizobium sp. NFR13 TaxID=1566285 RepID=UPI002570C60D|nr:transcriptional regulator [Bradyrhizobium sp. NFR13]